jgi:hypothetical protein
MKKIYIASPYRIGDVGQNVRAQMEVFDLLVTMGHVPFAPLLFHFQHIVFPLPEAVWLELDFEWVRACDAVLRLPGESRGADMEVEVAKVANIPVFTSIQDLEFYFKN